MEDILLNDSGDLDFSNGDFRIGNSDLQHQRLLLLSEKGSWKETPGTGVGAFSFLEFEDRARFYNEIRSQYSTDGMRVKLINVQEGKIHIDAEYKN
jgi:hypothetical protein